MKLVDILARELKEFPQGGSPLVQGSFGQVYICGGGPIIIQTSRAEDWELAEVTRAQWQAAVNALKAEKITTQTIMGSLHVNDQKMHATGDAAFERMSKFINSDVVEWNGEGLPPVGTVCEWKEKTGFSWVKATVLFISESSVVMQREDGFEWQMLTKRTVFRPIHTPEQIAEEEKQRAVSEMEAQIAKWGLTSDYNGVCQALYDAGYRKFEIVDN